MKRTGIDNKKRFSLLYPNGHIDRFGTCDPKQDERMGITCVIDHQRNPIPEESSYTKKYYLVQYQKDDTHYTQPEKQRTLLEPDTLATNGYYDHEHDGWKSLDEFINQPA